MEWDFQMVVLVVEWSKFQRGFKHGLLVTKYGYYKYMYTCVVWQQLKYYGRDSLCLKLSKSV